VIYTVKVFIFVDANLCGLRKLIWFVG